MIGKAPLCLTCQYFKGRPTQPGGSAKCAIKGTAPKGIYFDAKNCSVYKSKVNGSRKK